MAKKITNNECPKCGSHKINTYPGLFVDRYMCRDCGYEWR